jgi:hypothetical protein
MFEEWQATAPSSDGEAEPVNLPGRPAAFAGSDAVRYVTEFEDPRSSDDDVAVLTLDGCFAHTEVELQGAVLGSPEEPITHDAYFAPLRIPFRPADEERVVVTCEAPRDRFGGLFATDAVPDEAAVPGVWWQAALETRRLPYVEDVAVTPELTADGATLHVRITVVADEAIDDRITYSLKPAGDLSASGMMNRGSVQPDGPGRTTVEHTIEVRDPSLWWPRGYGDQNRYTLRAKLGESEHTVTTGIRSVEREDGDLLVNGEHVPIRGVNLTTAGPRDVERALGVNANLVRAHAQVLPPSLYDACDEAGLLVWQDLPLTGPGSFDVERASSLGSRLVDARSNHPSLATLAVHDEPTDAFADGLGSGFLDGLRRRWRAWRTDYDRSAADDVAAALPDEIPVVPVVGDPGVEAEARRLYPGWDYGEASDAGDLLDRYPAPVVAEFGAGALGDRAVEDAAGFDAAKHAARGATPGDPAASQAAQAAVVGTVAETVRRRGQDAIAYALRDTDAAGMGIVATDGQAKQARDALARAFEPVQAFLASPAASTSAVVVCNDTVESIDGELSWTAGDASGGQSVTVAAGGRWEGEAISIPSDAEAVTLELDVGDRTVENVYQRT